VVDTRGDPLRGAAIWVETELYVGTPGRGLSDADGRYLVTGLRLPYVYSAHARLPIAWDGRDWCLRLAPLTPSEESVFAAAEGAFRDFAWRLSGPVDGSLWGPDEDGSWWGGTVRLFPSFEDGRYDRVIELTLTPTGPLVDGSVGAPVVRTVDLATTLFALDIPLGPYDVSAVTLEADGARTPLRVAQTGSEPAAVAPLRFEPEDWSFLGCEGSGTSTGIERAFLDVVGP
jgi:hypothetical protein